ncbi:hypothetical protein [Actinopolyspora halophila]|uniref:hypothetical protein n=1 Tax=Actinopolyspora halophila TaxID=1850 RepID=UPI00037B3AE3|nr:hypothetical protein [Actinopolyspora halophila]
MSHTLDLVVVGSLNVDLTARVQRHPSPGETLRATELTTRRRVGVSAFGPVGNRDTGR